MLSILKVFNTFVKTFVQKDAAISHHNAKLSVHISAFIQGEPFVHKSTFNKQSTLLPTHNKNLDQCKSIVYHYRATSDPAYKILMKRDNVLRLDEHKDKDRDRPNFEDSFFIYQYIDIFSKTTTRKITTTKTTVTSILQTVFPKAHIRNPFSKSLLCTCIFTTTVFHKSVFPKEYSRTNILYLSHSKSAYLRSCKVYFSNIVNFLLRRSQLGPNNHNVTVVF